MEMGSEQLGSRLKVLIHSDAGVDTGFARVTHALASRLDKRGFEMSCHAVNWLGDWRKPMPFFGQRIWATRTYRNPADVYGLDEVEAVARRIAPDVYLVLNDLPVAKEIVPRVPGIPTLLYFPVDSRDLPQWWIQPIRMVRHAYTLSTFGQEQIRQADPSLTVGRIPHGVDTDLFFPISPSRPASTPQNDGTIVPVPSRDTARALMGVSDRFVVLWADRNSNRKNPAGFFEAVAPFAQKHRDVLIWLHASAVDEGGDLNVWIERYGLGRQVRFSPNQNTWTGVPDEQLNFIYNVADVRVSTSMGEGFGLIGAEVAAAGVAQIAPRFTCFEEVIGPGALYVDSQAPFHTPRGVTLEYPHTGQITDHLETLYADDLLRRRLGRAGREHVVASFNWDAVADQFVTAIHQTVADGIRDPFATAGAA